jgi:hypothetical protein
VAATIEQATGVVSVAVVLLAYLVVLQVMTASVLLLARYCALQWRSLRALLAVEPPAPEAHQDQDQPRPYRLGGDLRW